MLNPGAAQAVQGQIQAAIGGGTQSGVAQGQAAARQYEITWASVLNRIGGIMLTVFGTRAIYRFIEDSVMMFARFDQKLQQSVAIMQGVDDVMRNKLGLAARQVSKELNLSAEDLAGAYYYLASAGLTAEQSIKALPVVATFAKAGIIDLAKATEYLTEANTALGYKSADADKNMAGMARVADVLTLASKRSQTTIEQLAQALTNKAGNSLRLFGKDVEEGAAVLAVLANQGVKGALAGERLDIFLRQATTAATKHAAAFKAYNIEIFDSTGKMRDLADISAMLTKALGGLSDQQQVLALQQLGFQTRTVAFVKQFIGQADAIKGYETALRSAAGYTQEVADKQLQTPIERWGIFKQRIIDVRREIGENFISALTDMGGKLSDENDPKSLVGSLKQFAKWLSENKDLIQGLGIEVSLLVRGFQFYLEVMNQLADVIVVATAGPFTVLLIALTMLDEVIWLVLKPLGLLVKTLSLGYFHELDDLANHVDKLAGSLSNLATKAGTVTQNAWRDLFGLDDQITGKAHTLPKMTTTASVANNADNKKTGMAQDILTEQEIAKIKTLQEELTAFIAKHTATREDDQLAALAVLERKFEDVYKNKVPKAVKDSFALIKSAIADENLASSFSKQLDVMEKVGTSRENIEKFIEELQEEQSHVNKNSTAWAQYNATLNRAFELKAAIAARDVEDKMQDIEDIDNINVKDAAMHDFIEQMKRQRDQQVVGSKEWEVYRDMVDRATKALKALHKEIAVGEKKQTDDAANQTREERLLRIGRIGADVAKTLESGFSNFFRVLLVGSKRGSDAFEQMGRKIAESGLGAIAEYASNKARVDFIEAADETWKGFAALSDPFMAWTAPGHFEAAAQAAAAGTAWAALGGGVGGIASAVGNSSHGLSGASESGASTVAGSTQQGNDIAIYIDGVDPKNPRHQKLIGATIQQYADRTGGTITVK